MKKSLILVGMLGIVYANAQEGKVGINTENPTATLEVQASATNLTGTTNEGIIAPKLSKARIANIAEASLVEGTLVYATDATYTGNNTKVKKIDEKGYYFYNGTEWVKVQHTDTNTELWAQRVSGGITETYLKPANEQNNRVSYIPNRGLDVNIAFIPEVSQNVVGFRNATLSSRNNETNEITTFRGITNSGFVNTNTTIKNHLISLENNLTIRGGATINNGISGGYDNVSIEENATFTGGSVWASRGNITLAKGVILPAGFRLYGNNNSVVINGSYDSLNTWGARNAVNLNTDGASAENIWLTEAVLYGADNNVAQNVSAFRFWNANSDKITVANSMRGLHIDAIINGQKSNYGIYLSNVGNDTATDNYAIYTNQGINRFGDKVIINKGGDGEEILRLNTDRPWVFKQVGQEAEANLALQSQIGNKLFIIQDMDGNSVASFKAVNTDDIKGTRANFVESGGRVGIGVSATETTHTLHVKAESNPLKLEGLQSGTGEVLVVDANGVVKTGTATSITASNGLQNTENMVCNASNRGKMNFIQGADGKSDVFGICMKNADGKYYWGYMVGGNNPTNGTGSFGSGL